VELNEREKKKVSPRVGRSWVFRMEETLTKGLKFNSHFFGTPTV